MNDEDHYANCYVVAHHGEEDEVRCNTVMEHPLIEFPLLFPSDEDQLKYRENMNA